MGSEGTLGIATKVTVRIVPLPEAVKTLLAVFEDVEGAFGAMGRLSPEYYVVDGVVPRTRLPQVLAAIGEVSARYGFPIANVFHAGDGNLHPLILFDGSREGDVERVKEAGAEIMKICIDAGGRSIRSGGCSRSRRPARRCFAPTRRNSTSSRKAAPHSRQDKGLTMPPGWG